MFRGGPEGRLKGPGMNKRARVYTPSCLKVPCTWPSPWPSPGHPGHPYASEREPQNSSLFEIPALLTSAMVRYIVYKVYFTTKKGTRRSYVGYTRSVDLREQWHKMKPPAWVKPRKQDSDLKFEILEQDIQNSETALALEALHAARHIAGSPDTCRGGPWLKPTMPDLSWLQEVRDVARMTSLMSVSNYAAKSPDGNLSHHLKDLEFVKPDAAPQATPVRRAVVIRKSRSGTPGNRNRADQVRRGTLKAAGGSLRRSHRGKIPKDRRAVETSKRVRR